MIPSVPWPPGLATTFVETSKYGRSVGWFHGSWENLVLEVCSKEIKLTNKQKNKKDEDKTQNAEAVAVNNEPKKKSKRIPFDKKKSKPLVRILRIHSSYQSKHPASSLKERMSPTMTSKKHVTFWTTTLEDTQANKSKIAILDFGFISLLVFKGRSPESDMLLGRCRSNSEVTVR